MRARARETCVELETAPPPLDPEVVKADFVRAGFKLVGESQHLRTKDDDYTKNVFDPALRGKTDRFVFKFRKPK